MTIKQQGGIFGRNPSFNDVDVNKLDVDGVVIDPSSSAYFYAVNDDPANKNMFDFRTTEGGGFRLGATAGSNPTHWVQTFFDEPLEVRIGGTSPTFTFEKTGNATIEDGNLIIGTSGHGIDFSATAGTGTSELFSDYEEGSWTPALAASGGGSASYSRQNGRYTKIGDTVFAYFQLSASKGTLSGSVSISGLPFTSLNLSGLDAGSVSFNRVQRFVTTFNPYGHVTGDSTSVGLFKGNTNESTDATADGVPLDAVDLNTTSTFRNYCFGVAIYHTS